MNEKQGSHIKVMGKIVYVDHRDPHPILCSPKFPYYKRKKV